MARRKKHTAEELHEVVEDQPLVGVVVAAQMLGIANENMGRLRKAGKLPREVPVEGMGRGGRAYVRSEVEKLARQMRREREQAAAS